jgi:hypothetical protein
MFAAVAMTTSGAAMAAVSEVDGAGGGGIVPWALLSGDDAAHGYGAVACDGLAEDDIGNVFIAYFPNKTLVLVGAYADLGQIATDTYKNQRALYLQVQATF